MRKSTKSSFSEFFDQQDANIWVTTYADMMTLLLVFFILLYSIYYLDAQRFKASLSSIQISVDQQGETVSLIEFHEPVLSRQMITLEEITGLSKPEEYVRNELQHIVDAANLGNRIFAYVDADKVVLQVPGELLFDSGQATLNATALPLFDTLQKTFDSYPDYTISIRGHTDNRAINTQQFPSNWELSAVRATTVLRYFLSNGTLPERISATGYADLLPIDSNDTPEGRSANRRVEFVLEKLVR